MFVLNLLTWMAECSNKLAQKWYFMSNHGVYIYTMCRMCVYLSTGLPLLLQIPDIFQFIFH